MTEQVDTKRRERSPEYPAFDLEEAVNKARLLYQAERRNAAPMNAVLKHWGYSPKSGAGIRAVSTLEKFGLAVSEGSGDNRKVRLSENGFNILVDGRPDSLDRLRILQEAALKPTAHAELWEKYPNGLPSEDTLRFELQKRGFSEGAANDLIEEYRDTLAFAKLEQGAILTGGEGDKLLPPKGVPPPGDGRRQDDRSSRQKEQGMTVLSLQISDRLIELAVPGGPLTKGELRILGKYLEIQEQIAPEKREDAAPAPEGDSEK